MEDLAYNNVKEHEKAGKTNITADKEQKGCRVQSFTASLKKKRIPKMENMKNAGNNCSHRH